MKRKKAAALLIVLVILMNTPSMGCIQRAGLPSGLTNNIQFETVPFSRLSEIASMPMAVSMGGNVIMNYTAEIDASNTKNGYIAVRYLKKMHKAVKVIVKGPGGTPYIYTLKADGEYVIIPLSEGNGDYRIMVYENVIENKYSLVLGTTQSIQLADEFAPFIRPNQYVDYNPGSKAEEKAAELTGNLKNTDDKITAIYNYVIKNITYDHQLASIVQSGYIPDVDGILKRGKGICFDYAALMTAMLRSQGIPAKLVVGYRGKAYHAWVSVYSKENGWQLMDPTFDYNSVRDASKYTVAENNYVKKYIY